MMTESATLTFLDALAEALSRASVYNRNDQAPPCAVLWTDKEREWESLLPLLRPRLPLLTLGPYRPETRTGPAYYLRCLVDRALADEALPDGATPIIYLPGVSRFDLRAVDECPALLRPLLELQYRGVLWAHRNGRDLTPAAFLGSSDALGIAIGADGATRAALGRALTRLADEPLAHLRRAAPLQAAYFNGLLVADEVRAILRWLSDPDSYRQGGDAAQWASFGELCARSYGFSPQRDGPVSAAALLGGRQGPWEAVWQRFAEAPVSYPGIAGQLRRARPQGVLPFAGHSGAPETWPQDNEAAEAQLRAALLALAALPSPDARAAVLTLEAEHGARRRSVWATLGQARLAGALEHLAALATVTARPLGGATVAAVAGAYAEWGWTADAAVIDALAAVEEHAEVSAVRAAVGALYREWLEAGATALQRAVAADGAGTDPTLPSYRARQVAVLDPPASASEPGTCLLFADGLRFDAGQRLAEAVRGRGLDCTVAWGLTALPSVTPTAKYAVTPVAGLLAGGAELEPVVAASGGRLGAEALRRLLREAGYQVLLDEDELGDPTGLGWTELGAIDSYGHEHGWKVAHHLAGEVRTLAGRIGALLDHGWRRVVVVTDHGWLLLPGGLPKAELPKHLAEPRKGRCARLAAGAETDQQTVPWQWDAEVRIAVPPGIRCYESGREYDHGGVSPQECVVPVLVVAAATEPGGAVTIARARWVGLRCRITVDGVLPGAVVDIRTKPADAATSVAGEPRPIGSNGQASLTVPDDGLQGAAAVIVILDTNGHIQAQHPTVIGEDS